MFKRGQISLFIIVGIVIFAVIIFFLFLGSGVNNNVKKENVASQSINEEAKKIQGFVDSCIEVLSKEAVDNVYSFGGYSDTASIPRKINEKTCLVYSNENIYSNYAPTQNLIEARIKNYIENKLNSCLNFQEFKSVSLEYHPLNLTVSLPIEVVSERKTLDINFYYNLSITKGNQHIELKHSKFTMPSNLVKIIKIVSSFIAGNEAGSLNSCNNFLPCNQLGISDYCNIQGSYCNANCEGVQINCVDSVNREYSILDNINGKAFYFSICRALVQPSRISKK